MLCRYLRGSWLNLPKAISLIYSEIYSQLEEKIVELKFIFKFIFAFQKSIVTTIFLQMSNRWLFLSISEEIILLQRALIRSYVAWMEEI